MEINIYTSIKDIALKKKIARKTAKKMLGKDIFEIWKTNKSNKRRRMGYMPRDEFIDLMIMFTVNK